jgi:hypothetical protein
MPDRLRPWLIASFLIGLVQLALSPWGAPYLGDLYLRYSGQPLRVSDSTVYAIWWFLIGAWLVVVVAGLRKLGRRGGWLFLSTPLALLPVEFFILLVAACLFWQNCL